jgi:ribosomal protein L40E
VFKKGFLTVNEDVFNKIKSELKDDEEVLLVTNTYFGDNVLITNKRILIRKNEGVFLKGMQNVDIQYPDIDINSLKDVKGILDIHTHFYVKFKNIKEPLLFVLQTLPGFPLLDTLKNAVTNFTQETRRLQNLKTCPKCNAKNESETVFCEVCGVKFEEETIIRFCPECGEKNKSRNKFCVKCGIDLR